MSWERKVQKKPSWSSSTQAPRESLFKTQGFSKPVEEPVEKIALKPIQFRGRDTSHLDHIKVNTNRPIVTPRVNLSNLQTKLTVGAPGDKYEQEADSMAQKVMSTPDSAVQRMMPGEEEEVRAKPLAANITPLVQREEMPEEKEELQAKPLGNGTIQREEMLEEKEEVQAKPLSNGTIQREEMPEEKEEVQAKPLVNGTIQREEMPEEKEIQTKPLLQRTIDGSFQARGSIESQLNSSKGAGSPLEDNVRGFMEPRFGADFSSVRVHTGLEAIQMNRDLEAQAFTHGNDVYFGAGKAPGNNELTAHELTHVVQQIGEARMLQRECNPSVASCASEELLVDNQKQSCDPSVASCPSEGLPMDNQKQPEMNGNPSQPSEVGQTLIDRLTGKFAEKDGDPGEGFRSEPYNAAEGQCTIGYGHVIRDKKRCQPDTNDSKKCICNPPLIMNREQALAELKSDIQIKLNHVKKEVHVELNQAEFDALVDLALHKGSLPKDFVKFLHDNWDKDREAVRDRYLKTAVTMKDPKTGKQVPMKNFVERRQRRAWTTTPSEPSEVMNSDELGLYYSLRTEESETLYQLQQLEQVSFQDPDSQLEKRNNLMVRLNEIREQIKTLKQSKSLP